MYRRTVALAAVGLILATSGCAPSSSKAVGRKVIVLGVDGMDPRFVEDHWNALPNLERLRRSGEFKRLATTTPPQSPVAWSTFATGLDPAQHGIFDFVHRDPVTMQPLSSMAETQEPRLVLPLGPWAIPLGRGMVRSFRKGRTFWEILGEGEIPVTLLRMPTNYPAMHFEGRALSGMGAPDLRGTFGTFTLFTDSPFESTREASGGRIVQTRLSPDRAVLSIEGPVNSLRKDRRVSSVPMTVDVDPVEQLARFTVLDRSFILRQGEWSDWIPVRFSLIPGIAGARGMFRVYASELHPGFRVYVSPVNADPADPDLPIAWPDRYSSTLARSLGRFYTQGIREDTAALRESALSLPEYLAQSRHVFQEDLALLRHSLKDFSGGLLFFYFSSIDQDSHMLWVGHDRELLDTYRAVDGAVGEVMAAAPDATLIVMSDHGFSSFTRSFNINTWLQQHNYLSLAVPLAPSNGEPFQNVDWSRTKAYSIGLNGLYLNLFGRERKGVVPLAASDKMLDEIATQLLAARDPANGNSPILSVSRPVSAHSPFAPDLIIGYSAGYRASWGAALGVVENEVVQDNAEAWIGDHCIAASEVPGVLIANRKSGAANPELKDLTVTLLRLFGVTPAPEMTGLDLYRDRRTSSMPTAP